MPFIRSGAGMREDKKLNGSGGRKAEAVQRTPLASANSNANSHAKTPSDPSSASVPSASTGPQQQQQQQRHQGGGRQKRATLPTASDPVVAAADANAESPAAPVSRSQENLGVRQTGSARSASNSGRGGNGGHQMKKSSSTQGIAPAMSLALLASGVSLPSTNSAGGQPAVTIGSVIVSGNSESVVAGDAVAASDGAIAASTPEPPACSLERDKSIGRAAGGAAGRKAEAERLRMELEASRTEAATKEVRLAQLESECQRLRRAAAAAAAAAATSAVTSNDDGAVETAEQQMRQRLAQMEEANFSATEELQATLLELAELQLRNTHLTDENENLMGEKQVLLESLYHQTESLDRSRRTVESLKSLLTSDVRRRPGGGILADRERQLLELLDLASAEKAEAANARLESERQFEAVNSGLREQLQQQHAQLSDLKQQAKSDEIDRLKRDRLVIELEGRCNSLRREVARFKQLYESSKADFERMKELNSDDAVSTASEMQSMLEQKEKLACELSRAQEELSRLDEANLQLTGQLQDLRLSAEKTATCLKEQLARQAQELELVLSQRQSLAESLASQKTATADARAAAEAEADRARQLETELASAEAACESLRARLADLEQRAAQELEEWRSYEQDLLRTVQVADDVKQEAERLLNDWSRERSQLTDEARRHAVELSAAKREAESLRSQLHQLQLQLQQQQQQQHQQQQQQHQREFPSRELASTVDKELANMRAMRRLEQRPAASTHVKSLIQSIEETVKRGPSPDSPPAAGIPVAETVKTRRTSVPTVPLEQQQLEQQQQQQPQQGQSEQQQQQLRHPLSRGHSLAQSALIRCSYPNMSTAAMESILDEVTPSLSSHDSTPPPPSAPLLLQQQQQQPQLRPSPAPTASSAAAGPVAPVSSSAPADPLTELAKRHGGSKRNGLLRWCQNRLAGYPHIDVTNFSTSWNDGMAMCGLLHCYLPHLVPYDQLTPEDKRRNFQVAFKAAESANIPTTLSLEDMVSVERPDWNSVMSYVASIYVRFENQAS